MLSPFSVLKDVFAVLGRNFLSILTAFSSLFCVYSFVQFIGSVSSICFASSVMNGTENIDFTRFERVAFLPSSTISTFAFFVLFLPLFLGTERMSLKWTSGEKPRLSELLWAFEPSPSAATFLKCIFYGIGLCGGIVIITFFLAASLVFAGGNSLKFALFSAFGKGEAKGLFSSLLPLVTAFLPLILFGGFFIIFTPIFILLSAVIFYRKNAAI